MRLFRTGQLPESRAIDVVAQAGRGSALPKTCCCFQVAKKAMTALGLLIAIFRLSAQPRSCILDEVDAPLDEAKRRAAFTKLVAEMSAGHAISSS